MVNIKFYQEIGHKFHIIYFVKGVYKYAIVDNIYGFKDLIYSHSNIERLEGIESLTKYCEMLNNRVMESR